MALNVGSVFAELKLTLDNFKNGLNQAKSQLSSLGSSFGSFGKIGSAAFDGLQQAGKALTVGLGAIGTAMGLLGKRGIDVAGDLQQAQSAYKTLLKSEEEAVKALDAIKKDAAQTPFDLRDLIRGNQMLISTGESVDKSREAVMALGNAIVATGGGTSEFNRMVANLQQIRNVGTATAMDIKQFGFAGINIYKLLSESTGKNIDQLKEQDISYEDLVTALVKARNEGGMFAGALEDQAANWNLVKSNLQDVINITLADIVTETGIFGYLNEKLIQLVDWLSNNKDTLVNWVKTAMASFQQFASKVGGYIMQFINFVRPAVEAFINWIKEGENAKEVLIAVFGAIGIAISSFAASFLAAYAVGAVVITAIAGLIYLLQRAWRENWGGIQEKTKIVIEAIKGFWETQLKPTLEAIKLYIQMIKDWWTAHYDIISQATSNFFTIIGDIFKIAFELIKGLVTAFLMIIRGDWGGAFDTICIMMYHVFDLLIDAISEFILLAVNNFKLWFEMLKSLFSNYWEELKNITVDVMNWIKDFLKRLWTTIKDDFVFILELIKDYYYKKFWEYYRIIEEVMKLVKDFLRKVWEEIKNIIVEKLVAIADYISKKWNDIKGIIESVLKAIYDFIVNSFTNSYNEIKRIVTNIYDTIKSIWENIKSFISGVISSIISIVSGGFSTVKDKITSIMGDIQSKVSSYVDKIEGAFKDMITGIKDGVADGMKSVLSSFTGYLSDMWNKAADLAKKIRDEIKSAMDKDAKNSPSIMETITDTVKSVNKVLATGFEIPKVSHDIAQSLKLDGLGSSSSGSITQNVNVNANIASGIDVDNLSQRIAYNLRN